jgi:ssDNA-binding Zn-finger/Zn-ribbon topoisomerase 1
MTDDIKCPICGSATTLRTTEKDPDAGKQFHVCNRYPECNGIIPISLDDVYERLEKLSTASNIQYRHTLLFAGATVGVSVTLVGGSMWVAATQSSDWQIFNGVGIMIIGFVFFIYCTALNDKLKKERARRGKL